MNFDLSGTKFLQEMNTRCLLMGAVRGGRVIAQPAEQGQYDSTWFFTNCASDCPVFLRLRQSLPRRRVPPEKQEFFNTSRSELLARSSGFRVLGSFRSHCGVAFAAFVISRLVVRPGKLEWSSPGKKISTGLRMPASCAYDVRPSVLPIDDDASECRLSRPHRTDELP